MNKLVFSVLITGVAVLAGSVGSYRAEDKPAQKEGAKMFKAVVHVNFADAERQKHGLKNVSNMLKAEGGKGEIEVVCHGPGIVLLVRGKTGAAEEVQQLINAGVRFAACENTLRDKSIAKEDLIPGVTTVPAGAVEVVRKQQEGYGYFRP